MSLEQLSLGPGPVQGDPDNNKKEDGSKAPRLPRWTRQEILVLIQGKREAENRVRRGRVLGSGVVVEPKWASVSSYCKRHGVNRGPVQCRKRWSNLAGDYKKIKEWESQLRDESESFWVMRNDLRRDRKLPGFFDREVYDILQGGSSAPADDDTVSPAAPGLLLALGRCSTTTVEEGDDVATAEEEEPEADAVFFDSGQTAAAVDDGLFSDSEAQPDEEAPGLKEHIPPTATCDIPAPVPISAQQYQPYPKGRSSEGTTTTKQDGFNPEVGDTSREQCKRKRSSSVDEDAEDTNTLQHQLIAVLEKNGQMLSAHLQSQNTNLRLDREQRKDHMDSLVVVLGKLADALGRIADKL